MGSVRKSNSSDASHPAGQSNWHSLSSRSCVTCHRRKVRCDRKVPCTNCSKADWTCVYPSKEKGLSRKPPSLQDVTDRLERVEAMLLRYCDDQGGSRRLPEHEGQETSATQNSIQSFTQRSKPWELLLNDGQRVQYVNNSNLKDLLQDEDSMKIQPSPGAIPPKSGLSMNVSPCILGLSPHSTSDVYKLHPDSRLALQLWSIYIKNVDPILKLLHIPTAQSTVVTTILDPKSAGAPMLALVFAIYFAAITTLSDQDVISLSGESPYLLLNRYKTGLNQVLVGADLLNNPELVSLQALAIFVTCLRVHDTSRGVWVLHGIAIRLAQSIGLHRDGTSLNLSPFETELRLRLWWHLCLLDSRAPEDHGFELTIDTLNRGPRLPLNINDSQICPNMSTLPKESDSWTEMSFSLVQIEAAKLLHPVLGTREESSTRLQDLAAKRKLIQDRTEWLKGKYFTDFDPSSQLSRAAFQHYSTACKKMEFMLQIREEMYTQQGQAPSRSEPVKTSFMGACDTLEASYALTNGEISMQFTWLFKTYTQWYALAYALRCLCANPCMAETDRAWSLVNNVLRCIGFDRSGPSDEAANSSIWRCLTTLRTQALAARKAANPPGTDTQLPHSHSIPNDVGGQHVQSQVPLQGIPIANYTAQPLPGSYSMENVAEWPQGLVPLSIPDVPCLPQWNAVVNGSLEPGLM